MCETKRAKPWKTIRNERHRLERASRGSARKCEGVKLIRAMYRMPICRAIGHYLSRRVYARHGKIFVRAWKKALDLPWFKIFIRKRRIKNPPIQLRRKTCVRIRKKHNAIWRPIIGPIFCADDRSRSSGRSVRCKVGLKIKTSGELSASAA